MSIIDELEYKDKVKRTDVLTEDLRDHLIRNTKDFKRSWVELGRGLYTVYRDKLYYTWGYEKFDNYTESELGIRKPTALKMLKSYFFLEQEEPEYLKANTLRAAGPTRFPTATRSTFCVWPSATKSSPKATTSKSRRIFLKTARTRHPCAKI